MIKLQEKIDGIRNVNVSRHQNTIPWRKAKPFKEIVTYKQYMNPFYYFETDKAKQIILTHSIRSDIYWINEDCKRKQSSCLSNQLRVSQSVFKRVGQGLFYALLLVLGCCTVGFSGLKISADGY